MLRSGYDLENLNMVKETEKISHDTKECYKMTFTGKGRKPRKETELKKPDKKKYPKKKKVTKLKEAENRVSFLRLKNL